MRRSFTGLRAGAVAGLGALPAVSRIKKRAGETAEGRGGASPSCQLAA